MKKRLIPCIFLKNGMIVRSEDFKIHQIIGNPINQVKRFSDWDVDEIIYIDISESNKYHNRRYDHKIKTSNNKLDLLSEISKYSQSWYDYYDGAAAYNNSMFSRDTATLLYFNYKTTHSFSTTPYPHPHYKKTLLMNME